MQYEVEGHRSFRIDEELNRELMANFEATITEEVRIIDGLNTSTQLTIEGLQPQPDDRDGREPPVKLPPITVDAESFAGMGWVMPGWGVRAVIRPGSSMKDDLRACIQLRSRPKLTTIYRHLGWTQIDGKPAYLHAGGAIGPKGNDASVKVQLSPELSKYDLSAPVKLATAVGATLGLLKVTKPEVTWPLLTAAVAPLFGPCDFAVHVSGRTGTFKSELMSLFQSFYGPGMDARNLPGSWSSTPNAIEAQAFYAKNAAYVLDDFVPSGTSWQVRAYQQAADKVIRAQGNQAGRARLTDASALQQTMYPRGIILSTGEDTPEGHSVRARMMIIELSPGDIEPAALTTCQKMRPFYSGVIQGLAQRLAAKPADLTPIIEKVRLDLKGIGHTRTPSMMARMIATAEYLTDWWAEEKVISPRERSSLFRQAVDSIKAIGNRQVSYLEDADPADQFAAAVRQVLASGGGHLRTLNGGVPKGAEMLGWSEETASGEMPVFKSRGPCIGWVNWQADELMIEINTGYAAVRKVVGSDMAVSKQTLFKRLKDAGALKRTDEARQRNTVRVMAEGHPRQVIALSLSETLELNEVPQ